MIVEHNPGLEELVAQLTGERQDLPTAALAQIVSDKAIAITGRGPARNAVVIPVRVASKRLTP